MNGNQKDKSRKPLPPDPEAVQRQYGEHADLYAEVRAETAASAGREDAAREWEEVVAQIEKPGPGTAQKDDLGCL